MSNEKKLKEIICKIAKNGVDINDINDNTLLIDDLRFDSIQLVSLVVEIEFAFNIEINDADIEVNILSQYALLKNMVERTINGAGYDKE